MAQVRMVRDINQARALILLRRHKNLSRAQLARELNLAPATTSALASSLMDQGLVVEFAATQKNRGIGRPPALLRLNPSGPRFLGAEFRSDHLTVVSLGLDGTKVARRRVAIRKQPSIGSIVTRLSKLTRDVLDETKADPVEHIGLGFAVPGMLDRDGKVFWLPRLGWQDSDLQARLEERLGLPVILDNDANASAAAELLFNPEPLPENFLYLLLDYGVGSAVVRNRAVYRGAHGIGGEAGHIRLDPNGPPCTACGGRGCFETFANGNALLRYHAEAGGVATDLRDLGRQLNEGDPTARAAADQWLTWLTRGVVSLMYVLDPAAVLLGGRLTELVPNLDVELHQRLEAEGFPRMRDVAVSLSAGGEDVGAVGAAALMYQQYFRVSASSTDTEVLARS